MKRRNGNNSERADVGPLTIKKVKLTGKVRKGSFEHRFERRRYLNQLVNEFQTTESMEAKQQVVANLANFAYDPYNYHFFQEIGVIPLFLAELTVNRNETLVEFSMGGICNCAADTRIQKEILKNNGLPIIKRHAQSDSGNTTLSCITTLISFLDSDLELKDTILSDDFQSRLMQLAEHGDKRVKNVSQILLEDLR
ncbi:Armadillo repeat-containing protein 7 [Orchesella cincta]|uniref:Armadillo repeat-containing protein 7 n=1 Tax=Orchesella cincta TaxID=48709 RepID=A0A1D2MXN4_ORCCI|nr:Armadillo repeat-containing protein 7 [Orchesella cincta]